MGLLEMERLKEARAAAPEMLPEEGKDRSGGADSLVERARRIAGAEAGQEIGELFEPLPEEESVAPCFCADGYERRSPVQPYRTPAGYRRRQAIRIAAAAALLLLAVGVLLALARSGIFSAR